MTGTAPPTLVALFWAAGWLQLGIAVANVALPRVLHYGPGLRLLAPILRQIFWVHSVYVAGTVAALGGLCLFHAPDLLAGEALPSTIVLLLTLFWVPRVWIQLRFYDAAVRRGRPWADALFLAAVTTIATIFVAASVWLLVSGGLQ